MTKKILVCDDEANVRTFLKDLLTLEGFAVVEAESGAAALDSAGRDRPDLCILDLMLPDCSGVELLPRLKAANPMLAVVVITALGTVDNAVLSMKAGAYDFITKPSTSIPSSYPSSGPWTSSRSPRRTRSCGTSTRTGCTTRNS